MARYRFHCTNGLECVLDPVGRDIRVPERLPERARAVAQGVMTTLGGRPDWRDWQVTVHDRTGRRVLLQAFVPDAAAA
ncbi:hypothetical protein Q8W71_17075 [Methylobacterium sp. NEAU 140]|uniref:DUF6894 family protein n=1 Tax=Methylobacterium sp. NEAU 140 TaxID=3064945 RepID=UPI002734705C|nr:hypothetical protein [Methylobacterium sp. NEAU 140]MDP4024342.1 hypothetical protein [Methylobacterium sp. NEAU 140]